MENKEGDLQREIKVFLESIPFDYWGNVIAGAIERGDCTPEYAARLRARLGIDAEGNPIPKNDDSDRCIM